MRFVLCVILSLCFFVQCSFAQDFFEESFLGDRSITKILPFSDDSVSAGFHSYEIFPDARIGHAAVIKKSYYIIDAIKNSIIEDKDYYYVNGFHSETIIDVELKTETQIWQCTAEQVKSFQKLSNHITKSEISSEEIKSSYKSIRNLLTNKNGSLERVQNFHFKWVVGLQKFDDLDLRIDPSEKYGNFVSVGFK